MKKFVAWLSPVFGMLILIWLVVSAVGRAAGWFEGDPLVAIAPIIIVFIGSAIFQQTVNIANDMAEVKQASIVFLQQARIESELLGEMAKYIELLNNPMRDIIQKPDLN